MNSIQLTHFSWSFFFFPLNSTTRWERTAHSRVITQGECSSVLEGELTTNRQMIHVETMEWGSCRLLLEQKEVKSYSFLLPGHKELVTTFLKKEEEEECIPKPRLPRAAGTIPALLSYTILVGEQVFLTFYVELAIFLGWAATLRKSFQMQISHSHLILSIYSWK